VNFVVFLFLNFLLGLQSDGGIIDVTNRREESPSEPTSPTDASLKPNQKVMASLIAH
jgi:hypothetical protein